MTDFDDDNLTDENDGDKNETAAPAREISADLIRGHINTIILRSLTDGEKYGTEIIEEIERKSHGQYIMKQPTLYSALKRLESQGFVTSYWGGVSNGGRRRYFNLTDLGREEAEKNIDEWEYSRTVIDSLISSRYIDLASAYPDEAYDEYADEPNEETEEVLSANGAAEEDDGLYSPSSDYYKRIGEFDGEEPTDCAEAEYPVAVSPEGERNENKNAWEPIPDEPIYDYDFAADESCFEEIYSDETCAEETEYSAELFPHVDEDVPLPEDIERVYLDVPEDEPPFIAEDEAENMTAEEAEAEPQDENEEAEGAELKVGVSRIEEAEKEEETESEEGESAISAEDENGEEQPTEPNKNPAVAAKENAEEKADNENAEAEETDSNTVLSDFDFRKILLQSQIDKEYRKTLEKIYSSAITVKGEEEFPEQEQPIPFDYTPSEQTYPAEDDGQDGEIKKIVDENPDIRQEDEEAYKIAGYQSQELFDEHYATVKRVSMNMDDEEASAPYRDEQDDEALKHMDESAEHSESDERPDYIPSSWFGGRYEERQSVREEHPPENSAREETVQLPADESLPEQENVSFNPGLVDFTDILSQADADGIKVLITCGARTMAPNTEILYNKPLVRVKSALAVFLVALIEAIIVFANMSFMKVNAVYPLIMLVIPAGLLLYSIFTYIKHDNSKEKKLRTTRNITTAIVAFMVCVLIICAVAIIAGIKGEAWAVLTFLIMPTLYSFNIIIYALTFYAFAKRK